MTSEGRVALKFNLSSLPQNAEVTSAQFSIYRTGDFLGYDHPATMYISPINKSWTASSATWNNLALSCDDPVTDKYLSKGTKGWIEFDVTELFNGRAIADGIMLSCTTTNTTNSNGQFSFFISSDHSNSSLRPKLDIVYTGGTPITSITNPKEMVKIDIVNNKINFISRVNSKISSIELINISGQMVYRWNGSFKEGANSIVVPSSISKGAYLAKFSTKNANLSYKIIIQ